MTIAPAETAPRQHRGSTPLAWAVLGASVLEVVAPVITANGPGSSPGQGSGPELLITPVGWAFSIWGLIYTLAIVQAVAVLVVGAAAVPRRLQIDQLVLYLGGALWIVLAASDSSQATAAALLVMFVAAVDALLTVTRQPMQRRWLTALTRSTVGLYGGWVTAAVFLNVSTALVDSGAVEADQLGWQLVVLVIAVVVLLILLVAARGNLAHAAAGTWALIGITVTGVSEDTTAVAVVAVASAVVLVAATMSLRHFRPEAPTSKDPSVVAPR